MLFLAIAIVRERSVNIDMAVYRIRAHHGMCLAYFRGEGYSEEFTEHMYRIKEALESNPEVVIINETDDICGHCPNNLSGICTSMDKVENYDNKVLGLCGIEAGAALEWKVFEGLVKERVLDAGKRCEVCGGCQWEHLC